MSYVDVAIEFYTRTRMAAGVRTFRLLILEGLCKGDLHILIGQWVRRGPASEFIEWGIFLGQ